METTAATRFEIINPHRWISHPITFALMGACFFAFAGLLYLGSDVEFSPFLALPLIGLLLAGREVRRVRNAARNYVELKPGLATVVLSGRTLKIERANVASFRTLGASSFPFTVFGALLWIPADRHIEIQLARSVWLRLMPLSAHLITDSITLQPANLEAFTVSLGDWLSGPLS